MKDSTEPSRYEGNAHKTLSSLLKLIRLSIPHTEHFFRSQLILTHSLLFRFFFFLLIGSFFFISLGFTPTLPPDSASTKIESKGHLKDHLVPPFKKSVSAQLRSIQLGSKHQYPLPSFKNPLIPLSGFIKKDLANPSNYNRRIRFIVLHYTALEAADSLRTLKDGGVSAHYLIPKKKLKNGYALWQLVDISDRAWHAGPSNWKKRDHINDTSIGIELVNKAYGLVQPFGKILWSYQVENEIRELLIKKIKKDPSFYKKLVHKTLLNAFLADMLHGLIPPADEYLYFTQIPKEYILKYRTITLKLREKYDPFLKIQKSDLYRLQQKGQLQWDPYTLDQQTALVTLLKNLLNKIQIKNHNRITYEIDPTSVIGHSDIAPDRKSDPGPLFPWKYLAEHGIGAWPDEEEVTRIQKELVSVHRINIAWLQDKLFQYGYSIKKTKILDERTKAVVRAFQLHFQPDNYSGIPTIKTIALLEALMKKYYPEQTQNTYPRPSKFFIKAATFFNHLFSPFKRGSNKERKE